MSTASASTGFPFPTPPAPGQATEVAPGILWVRMALPFRLDHVNLYLIEDGDGYAALDTGIGNDTTRAAWEQLLDGVLRNRPLTRVIATHYHPDHVGLAGWLCARTGTPLLMSQTEYLTSLGIRHDLDARVAEPYLSFYRSHGFDEQTTTQLLTRGQNYLHMVSELPRTFQRLVAGDTLRIGARAFDILSGGGHAPEQLMLYSAADDLLLCADQVLARITPNVSVQPIEPDGDPLGLFLRSLGALRRTLPARTLLLPGHGLPFLGLHERVDELVAHHEQRCDAIRGSCRGGGRSVIELLPVLFDRKIDDPHQMGFAFGEALAHVNFMLRHGQLRSIDGRYHAPP